MRAWMREIAQVENKLHRGPAGQQAKADAAQHPGQGAQPQAFPQRRHADAAQDGRHAQGAFHPSYCLPFCHTNTSKKL